MSRRLVYIDCDPGVDDCIALLVALGSSDELTLAGVGVVAGNVEVDTCARNAAGVLSLAGRTDIPVYVGCRTPMQVAPVFAEHIHGESGLGDAELPSGEPAAATSAVDALTSLLREATPSSVTLVVTGPMTNLATVIKRSPELGASVCDLIIMGGAWEAGGNITPRAEFNVYADPHAAQVVLSSGWPITLIGLDATLQLRCTGERMARMLAASHPAVDAAAAMVAHVNRVYGEIYGSEGAALHDPCTVGYLLAPQLFTTRPARVQVVVDEGPERGHTEVDFDVSPTRLANVDWVTGLSAGRLFDLLLERMQRV